MFCRLYLGILKPRVSELSGLSNRYSGEENRGTSREAGSQPEAAVGFGGLSSAHSITAVVCNSSHHHWNQQNEEAELPLSHCGTPCTGGWRAA